MSLHFTTKSFLTVILVTAAFSGCQTDNSGSLKNAIPENAAAPEPYTGRRIDLRTLIISSGTAEQDSALALMKGLHDRLGVPYELLDSRTEQLTQSRLSSGKHGYYNAIILTDASLWDPDAANGSGFTSEEWHILHEYEKKFSVRESVVSGYPVTDPALGFDYGLENAHSFTTSFSGQWHLPAGGSELFEKVNTDNPLPLKGYAVGADAHKTATGPEVQPLLTEQRSGKILIALLNYPDGREVLFSGIANGPSYIHSQLLAYEFLNFATRGVFIGARQVCLNLHVDDLFLSDSLWDPDTNSTAEDREYRLSPHDVRNTIHLLQELRRDYPTAAHLKLDFAFNGKGTGLEDELYQTIYSSGDEFRYINHTFSHRDMDKSAGTTYQLARYEIEQNRTVWQQLNLPGFERNREVLVSGMHSGLTDRATSTPYPEGKNDAFLRAARDAGIRYLASDASRPNQNHEQFVDGYDILLLPRHPTALFFNVTRPATLQDEYNYMFHDSYVERGLDPATTPGANPAPLSYREILERDAEQAIRDMLSYSLWPHYFHQSNLMDYDGGKTLLTDWLETVLSRYERLTRLPIRSLPYYEIGRQTENRLASRRAGVVGIWNLDIDTVTLSARQKAEIFVTGLDVGKIYGGQKISTITVDTVPQSFSIDRMVNQ